MYYNEQNRSSFEPEPEVIEGIEGDLTEMRERVSSLLTDKLTVDTSLTTSPSGYHIRLNIVNMNTEQVAQMNATIQMENRSNEELQDGLDEEMKDELVKSSAVTVVKFIANDPPSVAR